MCFNFIVEFWMREVNCVWFRNTVGSQFLKVSMPKDAISLQATVKTAAGVHKLTIDRWGDSTHKYDNYNSRRHPTGRDQIAIKRYEADKIVMDPLPSPIPVMKKKNSTRYWPSPREEDMEHNEPGRMWHSHKHPNTRRERRSSPYYPHSPKYPGPSSEEEEGQQEVRPYSPENVQDPQDPWSVTEYETEHDVPELISYQLDEQGIGNEDPTDRPETPNGTPPKKLKDFMESTEKFDRALDDAIEIIKEQEAKATQEKEILNMAKLMINVTPNKVTYMDSPDTKTVNPGRHRNKVEYNKAEINHVIFLEAPGSPETDKLNTPPESPQSGVIPLIPKIIDTTGKKEIKNPPIKSRKAETQINPRKRMSPCKCNQPETCTSEATSTTAGDSGSDSEDPE